MTLEQMMLIEELMMAKIRYDNAKRTGDDKQLEEQSNIIQEKREKLYSLCES